MPNLIRYIAQEDPEQETIKTERADPGSALFALQKTHSSVPTVKDDSDCDIRERMYSVIKKFEDYKEFPYRDSEGNITVGIGENVHNLNKFMNIDWIDEQGNRIRSSQAARHYQDLLKLPGNNYVADYYKDKTPLRISEETGRRLYDEHINDDLKVLRNTFANFDKFPPQMQNVLLDIKYNTGNVKQEKWPNLHEAIANRNLEGIIKNVHRKKVGADRNQWAIDELRKIENLDY